MVHVELHRNESIPIGKGKSERKRELIDRWIKIYIMDKQIYLLN